MSLSWTKVTPTTRRASANGRTYVITKDGHRFRLEINGRLVNPGPNDGDRLRTLHACVVDAEADAEQHNKGKRAEGEQRPDPSPARPPTTPTGTGTAGGRGAPTAVVNDDSNERSTSSPAGFPRNDLTGPGDDTPSALNHLGTGSPDPGDVTDPAVPFDDGGTDDDPTPHDTGLPDPPPTEGNVIFDSRLRENGAGVLRPYVDTSPSTFITIKKDPNAKPNAATLPKSAWIGSPPGSNRP